MRFVHLLVTAGLVLVSSASLARACINDSESDKAETEFKSDYREKAPETPASEPVHENNLLAVGGTVAGLGLLVGAWVLQRRQ